MLSLIYEKDWNQLKMQSHLFEISEAYIVLANLK